MATSRRRKKEEVVNIRISTDTILRVLLIAGVATLAYYLSGIVIILLVAMLLAALIDPLADKLQKRKLPRGLAVALIYVIILTMATGAFVLVVPTMVEQLQELLKEYAPVIEMVVGDQPLINKVLSGELFEADWQSQLQAISESGITDAFPDVLNFIASTFGGILTVILVFILAYYFVIEEEALKNGLFHKLTPEKYQTFLAEVIPKVRDKLGRWLRGQMLIMFVIFLLTYVVLTILGVPFALVLAILAGLFEIIPYLGPLLSAVPAVIIAFSLSPVQAVLVGVFYFLIQQLEADFLTPKIMQRAVGLNPIISILSILIGYELLGIAGALFAVPTAMVTGLLVSEWMAANK